MSGLLLSSKASKRHSAGMSWMTTPYHGMSKSRIGGSFGHPNSRIPKAHDFTSSGCPCSSVAMIGAAVWTTIVPAFVTLTAMNFCRWVWSEWMRLLVASEPFKRSTNLERWGGLRYWVTSSNDNSIGCQGVSRSVLGVSAGSLSLGLTGARRSCLVSCLADGRTFCGRLSVRLWFWTGVSRWTAGG